LLCIRHICKDWMTELGAEHLLNRARD
jgi:hypothetical protein